MTATVCLMVASQLGTKFTRSALMLSWSARVVIATTATVSAADKFIKWHEQSISFVKTESSMYADLVDIAYS